MAATVRLFLIASVLPMLGGAHVLALDSATHCTAALEAKEDRDGISSLVEVEIRETSTGSTLSGGIRITNLTDTVELRLEVYSRLLATESSWRCSSDYSAQRCACDIPKQAVTVGPGATFLAECRFRPTKAPRSENGPDSSQHGGSSQEHVSVSITSIRCSGEVDWRAPSYWRPDQIEIDQKDMVRVLTKQNL